MQSIKLFFIVFLVGASNANAFSSLGVPNCLEWNEIRLKTNYGENRIANLEDSIKNLQFQSFVIGYVNAYATHFALTQKVDILKNRKPEEIMGLVDEGCQKQPSGDLGLVTFGVSFRLGGIALK